MDMIVRPISTKWFPENLPVNHASGLKTTIGSGDNGTVTIVDNTASTLKVAVAVAGTASASLSATFAVDTITVTLGTDGSSAADATKNTATLIANAINGIANKTWTATASGTGASAITSAVAKKALTAYTASGTPCPEAGTCLYDETTSTYYVCVEANNTTANDGWRKFTLTTY